MFGHADITGKLEAIVRESGIQTGLLTVELVGSTGAITTIEYESGALSDLRRALEVLAPVEAEYAHNARWGDGNGFSHVRSALLKTSLSLPVLDGELALERGNRWWRSTWTTASGHASWWRCWSGLRSSRS